MPLTTKVESNPGAGAEATVTVPAGKWWRVYAIHLKLVTSATVANRIARLIFDNGTNPIYKASNDLAHAATQTTEYSFTRASTADAAQAAASVARVYPIPDLVLAPGYRVRTVTDAIQVGDQYSEFTLLVEEHSSDPTIRWVSGHTIA